MALEDRIRGLQLEDRVHASVDEVLGELRTRIETDLQHMVDQLVKAAAEEREEAIVLARRSAFDEGSQSGLRRAAEAETQLNEAVERAVADAREQAREAVAQQVAEARAAAETSMSQALVDVREREAQERSALLQAARREEQEAAASAIGRLLGGIRALDGATSLSETLDALALAGAREAPRAAVLVVRNDRLHGWKLTGFGDRDSQPKAVDLGLNEGGVIGEALASRRVALTRSGDMSGAAPAFAELGGDGVGSAAPVVVGGRVVAVVYADNGTGDRQVPLRSEWLEVIEILARHAARCLEALTVQRTIATPPPRFWVPPPGEGASPAGRGAADPGARGA
jgi:GAF domain-containing protein